MPECQIAGGAVDSGVVTLRVQCPDILDRDQDVLESSGEGKIREEVLTVTGILRVECNCAPHGGERCIVMTQDPLETGIAIQHGCAARSERHRAIDFSSGRAEIQECLHQYVPAQHHVRICVVGSQRARSFCRLTSLRFEVTYRSGFGREPGHVPQCPCPLRMCRRKVGIDCDGLIECSQRLAIGGEILCRHLDLLTAQVSVISVGIVRTARFHFRRFIPKQLYLHLLGYRRSDVGLQRQNVSEVPVVAL